MEGKEKRKKRDQRKIVTYVKEAKEVPGWDDCEEGICVTFRNF